MADREVRFRSTLAGCSVTIYEHLDGRVSLRYGPHVIGRFDHQGRPLKKPSKQERGIEYDLWQLMLDPSSTTLWTSFPTRTLVAPLFA